MINKQTVIASVAGALLSAVVTLGGGFMEAKVSLNDAEMSRLTEVEARMDRLSEENKKLQDSNNVLFRENVEKNGEITRLRIKVSVLETKLASDGPGVIAVYELLDDLDVPAWCKEWVGPSEDHQGHFKMAHINSAYEKTYGVTAAFYVGNTDFEVHPVKIAAAFNENDLRTFSVRGWIDFRERVQLPSGDVETRRFWNFYHRVLEGPEFVCGWEVPEG